MLSQILAKIRGSEPEEQEQEQEQTLPMAAAALFFEVAWADHKITEHELELVRAGIMSQFGLSAEVVDDIVEESHKQHDDSVGVFPFTRALFVCQLFKTGKGIIQLGFGLEGSAQLFQARAKRVTP